MRYIMLIFGLTGFFGAGIIGYVWKVDCQAGLIDGPTWMQRLSPPDEATRERVLEFDREKRAWPFLLGGAAIGLLGTVLAFDGRRFSAMALLLAAAVGALVFHPLHPYVLICGSALFLAGVLALFVPPRASPPNFA